MLTLIKQKVDLKKMFYNFKVKLLKNFDFNLFLLEFVLKIYYYQKIHNTINRELKQQFKNRLHIST